MKRSVSLLLAGLAIALLLALAYTGIAGGIDQFNQKSHDQYTLGQIVQTTLQLVFGALSLAVIVAWFWANQWTRSIVTAWIVSVGLAGGMAPVVWGHSSMVIGVVAGLVSAIVTAGIAALLRLSARRPA